MYQTFSVIFPQLFCTVCAISAVISNFPHVFTDNIYLLNMSKKETPRIFLYRISSQISLQNIHESHSLRFARFFSCVPTKRNRYVDKPRDHANYSLTVSQTASLTNQPVLIISFSLMPNAVFTSYLMHHDLSINVLIKIHYLMQPMLF